jgi:hypothetical protein
MGSAGGREGKGLEEGVRMNKPTNEQINKQTKRKKVVQ